jgi:uncharacterized C2H2 Zn-finger protein
MNQSVPSQQYTILWLPVQYPHTVSPLPPPPNPLYPPVAPCYPYQTYPTIVEDPRLHAISPTTILLSMSSPSSQSQPANTVCIVDYSTKDPPKTASQKTGAKCTQCSKIFKSEDHLQRHVKQIHKIEPSFICKICNKAFRRKSNLQSHERIHSGAKPFGCPKCDMHFRWESGLKNHLHSKHPESIPQIVHLPRS